MIDVFTLIFACAVTGYSTPRWRADTTRRCVRYALEMEMGKRKIKKSDIVQHRQALLDWLSTMIRTSTANGVDWECIFAARDFVLAAARGHMDAMEKLNMERKESVAERMKRRRRREE